jgi:hypothetical protein
MGTTSFATLSAAVMRLSPDPGEALQHVLNHNPQHGHVDNHGAPMNGMIITLLIQQAKAGA